MIRMAGRCGKRELIMRLTDTEHREGSYSYSMGILIQRRILPTEKQGIHISRTHRIDRRYVTLISCSSQFAVSAIRSA